MILDPGRSRRSMFESEISCCGVYEAKVVGSISTAIIAAATQQLYISCLCFAGFSFHQHCQIEWG